MRFIWIPKNKNMQQRHEEKENIMETNKFEECTGIKMTKKVLANPPVSWLTHKDKADCFWKIIDMEHGELETVYTSYKSGSKGMYDVMQKLSHTAAACLVAIDSLYNKSVTN